MRRSMSWFGALCALLFTALSMPASALAGDWVEIYTEDAVTVSKKDVPGSNLVAFKGDTVYNQPMGRVMWVLLDNEHRIEWVDRLYTNHIIEKTNDFDYVLYQAFELPAIFADRDYVYHGKASRNAETGVVTLDMQSIEHPDAPPTVGVRAELVNSRYVLTPLEGGKKTRVEVEIMTDPKGMMPAWLTNLVQRSWPVETLNGIRGQFDKPHCKTHLLPGEAEEIAAAEAAAKAEAEAAEKAEAESEGAEGEDAEGEDDDGEDDDDADDDEDADDDADDDDDEEGSDAD